MCTPQLGTLSLLTLVHQKRTRFISFNIKVGGVSICYICASRYLETVVVKMFDLQIECVADNMGCFLDIQSS